MLKEIKVKDLRVGMFLESIGISWIKHPFMTNRFTLTSEQEIEKIMKCGAEKVVIDTEKGVDVYIPEAKPAPLSKPVATAPKKEGKKEEEEKIPVGDTVQLEDEMGKADEVYQETLPVVHRIIDDIREGGKIKYDEVGLIVDQLLESIFRNRYAAISLVALKTYDSYIFTHSINTTVYALALGRQLKLFPKQLKMLGVGAMLHDIGKASIPEHIVNKPGRYTEEEFNIMKTHPQLGAQSIQDTEKVSKDVLECILNHHERLDGTGYPRGLRGDTIGDFAKIISIVDCYDAITSDRVYQKASLAHHALRIIFSLKGAHYEPAFVDRFIQVTGIYPIGTVIKLNTGEIGIVTGIYPEELLYPDLDIFTDIKGNKLEVPKTMRLRVELRKPPKMRRKIDGIIPYEKAKTLVPDGYILMPKPALATR